MDWIVRQDFHFYFRDGMPGAIPRIDCLERQVVAKPDPCCEEGFEFSIKIDFGFWQFDKQKFKPREDEGGIGKVLKLSLSD